MTATEPKHADNPIYFDAQTFTGETLPPVMRDSDHFICWSKVDFEITVSSTGETKHYKAKTPLSGETGRLAAGGGMNEVKDQRKLAKAISTSRVNDDRGVGYYMRKGGNQTFLDLDGCITGWFGNNPVFTDKATEILALFPDT